MRVAFCGTRGLPANYGGFETAVDEISKRMALNGIHCDVFCRVSEDEERLEDFGGRTLIYIRGSRYAKLDTVVSSLTTAIYIIKNRNKYDHILWFNNANIPGIVLSLLAGQEISVNTDGLEWRRAKWSPPFKLYYYLCSWFASKICKRLISDSKSIAKFYDTKFGKTTFFIPYGCPERLHVTKSRELEILQTIGVTSGKYLLQITRFEPDNLPLEAANGFLASNLPELGYKLLLVGLKNNTAYTEKIVELTSNPNVLVLPATYEQDVLVTLRRNCACYVHGNSVGGTNPALLEAMADAPRIVAIDGPFSREVLGEGGTFFEIGSVPSSLEDAISRPIQDAYFEKRVRKLYQWDAVARCYQQLACGENPNYEEALNIVTSA